MDTVLKGADSIFSTNNLTSATKRVYEYLYEEIVSCRLVPGTALSEMALSQLLKTSRTPVREATMALEGEGLINRYPKRGCFVSKITAQDVNEIFSLRKLLEVAALRQANPLADMHNLRDLEQALLVLSPKGKPKDYFDIDRRLHNLLVVNCGNMRLIMIIQTLNGQIEQFRRISSMQPQRLSESKAEHLGIVRSLMNSDLEHTCALLECHIENVRASTLSVCLKMGLRDIQNGSDSDTI